MVARLIDRRDMDIINPRIPTRQESGGGAKEAYAANSTLTLCDKEISRPSNLASRRVCSYWLDVLSPRVVPILTYLRPALDLPHQAFKIHGESKFGRRGCVIISFYGLVDLSSS